ncbi:MAG: TolC family protein, partial [Schwartzia sp.]|nr:TolC family protein [Schwartzia sp. (in: firmicutes)]
DYHQSLVSAEGSLEAARYTLTRVVGLPQDTPLEPTDVFTYTPFPKTLPECEEYALAHRPDGKAADCRVKQYEAAKNAQKADWQPSINAIADKNVSSNYSFSKDRSDRWEVGLELSWNVFDNGVTSAKVNAAKEQENEARAEAENLWNDILLETRTAYAQMKAAEKNIRDTARAVQQAEESLKMVTARYDEGMDILLSVTKAQEKLNEARSNHLTALYEYNLGKATLEKAIGVPVALDVPRYMEAVEEGKSANEALKEAAISMPVEDAQGNG